MTTTPTNVGLMPFFPLTISSSMLESWNTCNMKGFREFLQHLSKGRGSHSVHLVAGAAYAKGHEVCRRAYFEQGESADYAQALGEEALIEEYGDYVPYNGDKDKKCLSNVINLYRAYFETFPLEGDAFAPVALDSGDSAIEYAFSIELPFLHPELGVPLHFVGRFDALVEFQGKLYGLDDKTKSGYPSQKQKEADSAYEYLIQTGRGKGAEEESWATRAQFTGYTWAMKQLGIKLEGFIIREAWFMSGSTWHHRQAYTPRREQQVENWGKQMLRQVEDMLLAYQQVKEGEDLSDVFNKANDPALCIKYGSVCPFMSLCTTELAEQYVSSCFKQEIRISEEARNVPLEEYLDIITGVFNE